MLKKLIWNYKKYILSLLLACILFARATMPTLAAGLEIHYIDVGQADAALIMCDGEAMLIDGGNSADASLMYSYLKNHGINHLKYIVGTHADEDHIGGLAGALNAVTVDTALCSVRENETASFHDFLKYLYKQGKEITIPAAGEIHTLGSSAFQIVGPIAPSVDNSNNNSIVIRLTYGNTSFLFTGDAEYEEEQQIINSAYEIRSDVLKIGHHGSRSSTSDLFLKKVNPTAAIISVGVDNTYGHPTQEIIDKLNQKNVTIYRTDIDGDIICRSDGKAITFSSEKKPVIPIVQNNENQVIGQNQELQKKEIPGNAIYILNTNSHKFHLPQCSSVSKMKEKNKLIFEGTREEAIANGYAPCGNCKP